MKKILLKFILLATFCGVGYLIWDNIDGLITKIVSIITLGLILLIINHYIDTKEPTNHDENKPSNEPDIVEINRNNDRRFARESINEDAKNLLYKAEKLEGENKISALDEAINWLLSQYSDFDTKTRKSIIVNQHLINECHQLETDLDSESILALYYFERGFERLKLLPLYEGLNSIVELLRFIHADFNFALHFAQTNQLVGLISCLRRNLRLSNDDEIVEYFISTMMLGPNHKLVLATWNDFLERLQKPRMMLPKYYYVRSWASESGQTTQIDTISLYISDNDDIEPKDIRNIYNTTNPIQHLTKTYLHNREYDGIRRPIERFYWDYYYPLRNENEIDEATEVVTQRNRVNWLR